MVGKISSNMIPDFNDIRKGVSGLKGGRTLRFNTESATKEVYAHTSFRSRLADFVFFRNFHQKNVSNAVTVVKRSFADKVGQDLADAAFKKLGIKREITAKDVRALQKIGLFAKNKLGSSLPEIKGASDFVRSVDSLSRNKLGYEDRNVRGQLANIAGDIIAKSPPFQGVDEDSRLYFLALSIGDATSKDFQFFHDELNIMADDLRPQVAKTTEMALTRSRPHASMKEMFNRLYGPDLGKKAFQVAGVPWDAKDEGQTISAKGLHNLRAVELAFASYQKHKKCDQNHQYLKESAKIAALDPSKEEDREKMVELHKKISEKFFFNPDNQVNVNIAGADQEILGKHRDQTCHTLSQHDAIELQQKYKSADNRVSFITSGSMREFGCTKDDQLLEFKEAVNYWLDTARQERRQEQIEQIKKDDPKAYNMLQRLGVINNYVKQGV